VELVTVKLNMGANQSRVHKDVDIREFYNMYAVIGRGAFATVRHCRRKDAIKKDKDVAIKIVRTAGLQNEEKQAVQQEIRLLLNINHPNIVKLHEVYVTKKRVHLVMELLEGGEMFDRIVNEGFFSEELAAFSIVQILDALIYLHEFNICHRDIKPENLFYSTRRKTSKLVIGDFGLAMQWKEPMKHMCGTPEYVAPEILSNTPYDQKVDCWSLGIVLYVLLCGYPPYYAETHVTLYDHILTKPLVFVEEDWSRISEEAKDLLRKLLIKDPKERLTAHEAKKHPWLTNALSNKKPFGRTYQKRMRRYTAVQKLRAGVTTMFAMYRMARVITDTIREDMKPAIVMNDLVENQDDLKADIEITEKE